MTIHVVFVSAYLGPTPLRALRHLLALPDAQVGLVTALPAERIPTDLALAGHYRVDDPLDPAQLHVATRAFVREWGRVDRLVGFLEHLQLALADVREELSIPGVHRETSRNFRDKNRMKRVLGDAGLPVARQRLVRGAGDALDFANEVGFPLVFKPTHGVGSQDTFRVADEGSLHAALERLMPGPSRPVQAEEFITGEEHTMESVCIDGEVVWQSSTFYLPGPLQVIENPWMQYCVLLPREEALPHVEAFRPTHKAAMKALGLDTGFSHMEWFIRPNGQPVIGEVAARPAGVNIMLLNSVAHEVDVWEKWVRLEVYREWSMPERRHAAGCAFLRGHGAGRTVAGVDGVAEVLGALGDSVVAKQLPQAGQPRSSHYEGEGWIILRDAETDGVVRKLRHVIENLKIRYR